MPQRPQVSRIHECLRVLESDSVVSTMERRRLADEAYRLAIAAGERLLQAQAAIHMGSVRSSVAAPADVLLALGQAEQIFASNGLTENASICRVVAARCLCDLGRDVDAIDTVRFALKEAALPAPFRAHAFTIAGLAQLRTGNHELAMSTLVNDALASAEASGDHDAVAHVHWALGIARLGRIVRREWPLLNRSVVASDKLDAEVENARSVLAEFDAADEAAAKGKAWPYIDMMRLVTVGLASSRSQAQHGVAALSSLAAAQLEFDPALAVWALSCKAELQVRHGHDADAINTLTHALALATRLGLLNVQRAIRKLQGMAFERLDDIESALAAQKKYLSLQLVSIHPAPDLRSRRVGAKAAIRSHARLAFDAGASRPHPAVERAIEHVVTHLGSTMSVPDIVERSGIGRRTLELAFKASVGCTISEFVKKSRLQFAADELLSSDGTIGDVAARAGYRISGAFSRDFHGMFGMTPSVWRRCGSAGARPEFLSSRADA